MGFHGDVKLEKTFIALIYGEIKRKSLNVEVKRLQKGKSVKTKLHARKLMFKEKFPCRVYSRIKFKY